MCDRFWRGRLRSPEIACNRLGGEERAMVYWLTRLASWLTGKVPRRARLALAGPLTTLVYYAWVSKRRVTIANMAQVAGVPPDDPRARRLARQSWRNYGRYLSDFFYLPNASREQVMARVRDVTPAPGTFAGLDAAAAAGKGIIIATAHFGAWDIAGVAVASRRPLSVLVDTFTDPRMDDLIQGQRAQFGLQVLRAEKSPRPILRALAEQQAVAIVADRPLPEGEGTPITFFGRRCYVPGGVAQLALLSGAPIAVGCARYDDQFSSTYYLVLADVIYPQRRQDRHADTIELTQQVYSALERVIAEHPDQWFMFRPFWPEALATPALASAPPLEPTAVGGADA
jgi:KDO2-lipid IV(A) lauroyltransferase